MASDAASLFRTGCGHCKAMKADYSLAAAQLAKEGVEGHLAAVDATAERGLASRFRIQGFPTLKLFRGGEAVAEYVGERRKEGFVAYMRNPPSAPSPKDEL